MKRHGSQMFQNKPIISQTSIKQLLNLQQLFHSRYLTTQLLNQMIALYVNILQCFNDKLYPLRVYFLSKIQFVLSRDQITKMVDNDDQNKRPNINGGLKRRESYLSQIEQQMMNQLPKIKPTKTRSRNNLLQESQNADFSFRNQQKQQERSDKINLQLQVMHEVQKSIKKVSEQVKHINKKQLQHDITITNTLTSQNNKINERIAKRKEKQIKKSLQLEDLSSIDQLSQSTLNKQQLIDVQRELEGTVIKFNRLLIQKSIHQNIKQIQQVKQNKIKINQQSDDSDSLNEQNNVKKYASMFKKQKSPHKSILQLNKLEHTKQNKKNIKF